MSCTSKSWNCCQLVSSPASSTKRTKSQPSNLMVHVPNFEVCQSNSASISTTALAISNKSVLSRPDRNLTIWNNFIVVCTMVGEELSSSRRLRWFSRRIQWHVWQNWQSMNCYNKASFVMPRSLCSFNLCYRFPPTSIKHRLGWQLSY